MRPVPQDPRAARAATEFAGRSTFDGWIVLAALSRHEAAALLPPELELVSGADTAPDRHLVLFVFRAG